MRFVIDMQAAQLNDGRISQYTINFALAVAIYRGHHEIILALSDLFPDSIEGIRAKFDGILLGKNIRVWSAPSRVRMDNPHNAIWNKTTQIIREGFIGELIPDLVHLGTLTHGYRDDVVLHSNFLGGLTKISAMLFEDVDTSVIDGGIENEDYLRYKINSAAKLSQNSLIFADDPRAKKFLEHESGTPLENFIEIPTLHASNQEDFAKKIISSWVEWVEKNELNHSSINTFNRKTLAYVSPMPPTKSGIANYSEKLVTYLSKYYDINIIDCMVDGVVGPHGHKGLEWLRENQDDIDRVIYHFGNSPFHNKLVQLIEDVPGVAVIHDFYLGDLALSIEVSGEKKNALCMSLYDSHGYRALRDLYDGNTLEAVILKYPANFNIIKNAKGVVVHSEYSKALARKFYGDAVANSWKVIPHIRSATKLIDKNLARDMLGINADSFLVTSFGHLSPLKLNIRLLNAWLESELGKSNFSRLVFVGELPNDDYGNKFLECIYKYGVQDRVIITGYVSDEDYDLYLAASDLSVQLRANSRGETSGAVYGCLSYGVPLILNRNGAMSELSSDFAFFIPDEFDDEDLVNAINFLYKNDALRKNIGSAARIHVEENNSGVHCARLYFDSIEDFYNDQTSNSVGLARKIVTTVGHSFEFPELANIASSIAKSLPKRHRQKTIFIDITPTNLKDYKTGIQRVVRALLLSLIDSPPKGYRIEPFYFSDVGGKWHLRYARKYTLEILGCNPDEFLDDPIDVGFEDILVLLDFSSQYVVMAESAGLLTHFRNLGVKIWTFIYDLLPIQFPEYFPNHMKPDHERWLNTISKFDGAICISKTIANEYLDWRLKEGFNDAESLPFVTKYIHLGADILTSAPTDGMPKDAENIIKKLKSNITFLMVGTVEPRKGHLQVIEAFNILWEKGMDISLCIVGKQGWIDSSGQMVKTFANLKKNKELNKRLFWFEAATDEFLEKIYAACDCLIAASYGEGFGLPLIEAAQHGIPIIARDIPVFREVAKEHALYFESSSPSKFSEFIESWILLRDANKIPTSKNMPHLTWEQSASQLRNLLEDLNCK